MITTIESTTSDWWRATLEDTPQGVLVIVYKRASRLRGGEMLTKEWKGVLDCPFHIACDRVLEQINRLGHPIQGRTR